MSAEAGASPITSPSTNDAVDVEEGDADTDEGFEEEVSAERVEHHEEASAPADPVLTPREDTAKAPEE